MFVDVVIEIMRALTVVRETSTDATQAFQYCKARNVMVV